MLGHHVGAGDRPVRHEYDALVTAGGQGRGDRSRMVGGLAEEHAGRPGPRQQPPQRAGVDALDDQRGQVGAQVERGLLEVVVQGGREPARVAARQRRQDLVGRVGDQRRVGSHLVVVPVDRRRRHPLVGRHDHPPPRALVGERRDHLAVPLAERRAAVQRERHVAARGCAASVSRSWSEVPRSCTRSSATSAAAPSAEPPASPPAIGMDLSTRTSAPTGRPCSAASPAAARSTMLWPAGGRWLASMYDATSVSTVRSSAAVTVRSS